MAKHKTPMEKMRGFDIEAFTTIAFDSPDCPTALMAGSFLENFLELSIDMKMERKLTSAEYAEIFTGYGPLSTFSAKIATAYAFNLIDADTRSDLTVIRQIRNEAAHSFSAFSFDDELIKARTAKLINITPPPKEFVEASEQASAMWKKVEFSSPRGSFIIAFMHSFNLIAAYIKIHAGRVYTDTLKIDEAER